jgi:4-hydroxy-tetrahydrodipicolinate reductase
MTWRSSRRTTATRPTRPRAPPWRSAREQTLAEHARFGREGIAPRVAGEIGIHAIRAGAAAGEHRVILASEGEQIEVLHRAVSRQTYAAGALRAARWLAEQPPGVYGMEGVL